MNGRRAACQPSKRLEAQYSLVSESIRASNALGDYQLFALQQRGFAPKLGHQKLVRGASTDLVLQKCLP